MITLPAGVVVTPAQIALLRRLPVVLDEIVGHVHMERLCDGTFCIHADVNGERWLIDLVAERGKFRTLPQEDPRSRSSSATRGESR